MHIKGRPTNPTQTAKPLADPDARVPGVPDHVQYPSIDPIKPVAVSAKRAKKAAKRRTKAVKRRLQER